MSKKEFCKFICKNNHSINNSYLEYINNLHTIEYGEISKYISEEEISKIVDENKNMGKNDYTKIDDAKDKKGIYIFYREEVKKEIDFLYV